MALERKALEQYHGVKFQNFPLVREKDTKGSTVWIFGGREFSIFGCWAGVEYEGRYRFHAPVDADLTQGTWDVRKMKERVLISDANGESKELEREYFCIEPSERERPQFYAAFIGGYWKTTFAGVGRDRDFEQYVEGEVTVLARTVNRCRSGRFGNRASFIIAGHQFEIEERGVR